MKQACKMILLIAGITATVSAAVSGRVVDGTGKAVADAMVCYTSLVNRLIYVYSDANGYFNIPAPTEWSLTDLPMYKPVPVTAIRAVNSMNSVASSLDAHIRGDMVVLSIRKESRKVSADLYDISGKRVTRIFDKVFEGGHEYVFNPFIKNSKAVPQQVYVVRLSDGKNSVSLRIINVCSEEAARFLDAPNKAISLQSSPELAKMASVDGVRAGKTGYFGTTVQINTYNDAVGNVAIKVDSIENRVDSLMSLLTADPQGLDFKIGQLMQPAGCTQQEAQSYFLGSYLKGEGSAGPMTGALATKYKIPLIVGNDWVHGGRHVYFPHEIGLGCANDTLLTELAYRIYAMCCLPLYNNELFGPCLDVHRSDKSGRVYEGFAETPELTVPLARHAIRGIQGTDLTSGYTMMATLKHWAAGGGTANGAGHGNANTAPNLGVLANIHFPPFLACVNAGAASVMTGYQSVFGDTMAVNKQLVTDTLKTAYGFDGFVITDWATAVGREARCLNAGNDLCMTVDPNTFPATVKSAVQSGSIPQSRIDDAVKRLLREKFRMGLFENPWPNLGLNHYLASQDYRNVARACVRKSLVLLKNTGNVLPLAKTAKVHVVGTLANNMGYQCGGWSATGVTISDTTNIVGNPSNDEGWQGTGTAQAINGATTILQGIQAACAGQGTVTSSADASNIPSTATVIVVVVGEPTYAEDNGDVTDITLNALTGGNYTGASKPPDQIALVQACKNAAGTRPVVTILVTGRPDVLGTIPTNSTALIAAWLPGTEGEGVSDVLFGDYKFTGKLSVTWPANINQDPINTGSMGDNTGSDKSAPLFAYGFGLTD
jgi:beta-glucosidase